MFKEFCIFTKEPYIYYNDSEEKVFVELYINNKLINNIVSLEYDDRFLYIYFSYKKYYCDLISKDRLSIKGTKTILKSDIQRVTINPVIFNTGIFYYNNFVSFIVFNVLKMNKYDRMCLNENFIKDNYVLEDIRYRLPSMYPSQKVNI